MHSCNPITSKDHERSSVKETKGIREDSFNNVDQDSARDPLHHNTIPPTHLVG